LYGNSCAKALDGQGRKNPEDESARSRQTVTGRFVDFPQHNSAISLPHDREVLAMLLSTTAPADVPRRKYINRGGRPPQPGSHPLRIWRLANDYTVAGLAALAELSTATVSRIENRRQTPSLAMIKRLIEASGGALVAGDFL
jgi:hypothetical protein